MPALGRHYLFLSLRVALEPVHEAVDSSCMYVPGDDFVFLNVDGDDDSAVRVGIICELIAILAAPLTEMVGEIIALRLLHPVILRHYPLKLIRDNDSSELLGASVDLPAEGVEEGLASSVERSNSVPGANTARRTISSSMRTPKPKTRMRAFFLVKPEHFCVIAYLHSAACKVSTGGNGSP